MYPMGYVVSVSLKFRCLIESIYLLKFPFTTFARCLPTGNKDVFDNIHNELFFKYIWFSVIGDLTCNLFNISKMDFEDVRLALVAKLKFKD